MILHPAHYIPQTDENLAYIYALEDARDEALKIAQKQFRNDRTLKAFTSEASFSHPNVRKRRVGPKYHLRYDEELALELAFYLVVQYKLDIKACIPPPLRYWHEKPDFEHMRVPEGDDYIFERNWEDPGDGLNLGDILKKYRHLI